MDVIRLNDDDVQYCREKIRNDIEPQVLGQ